MSGAAFGAAGLLAITAPWPVQAARVQADTASVALALCAFAVAFYARPLLLALGGRGRARRSGGLRQAARRSGGRAAGRAARRDDGRGARGRSGTRRRHSPSGRRSSSRTRARSASSGSRLSPITVTPAALGPLRGRQHRARACCIPLDWRTPAGVLVPIRAGGRGRAAEAARATGARAWIVVSALFLVAQQPLLDHHFVLLAATLAVPAGAGLGAAVTRIRIPARYAVAGCRSDCDRGRLRPGGTPALAPGRRSARRHLGG